MEWSFHQTIILSHEYTKAVLKSTGNCPIVKPQDRILLFTASTYILTIYIIHVASLLKQISKNYTCTILQ